MSVVAIVVVVVVTAVRRPVNGARTKKYLNNNITIMIIIFSGSSRARTHRHAAATDAHEVGRAETSVMILDFTVDRQTGNNNGEKKNEEIPWFRRILVRTSRERGLRWEITPELL